MLLSGVDKRCSSNENLERRDRMTAPWEADWNEEKDEDNDFWAAWASIGIVICMLVMAGISAIRKMRQEIHLGGRSSV